MKDKKIHKRDTFIMKCILETAKPNEIDDYIDKWHENLNYKESLSEFLGMSNEQYTKWIYGIPISDIIEESKSDLEANIEQKIPTKSNLESQFIGLYLSEGRQLAENKGYRVRIIRKDQQVLPTTTDFVSNRINFELDEGEITGVRIG